MVDCETRSARCLESLRYFFDLKVNHSEEHLQGFTVGVTALCYRLIEVNVRHQVQIVYETIPSIRVVFVFGPCDVKRSPPPELPFRLMLKGTAEIIHGGQDNILALQLNRLVCCPHCSFKGTSQAIVWIILHVAAQSTLYLWLPGDVTCPVHLCVVTEVAPHILLTSDVSEATEPIIFKRGSEIPW